MIFHKVVIKCIICTNICIFQLDPIHSFVKPFTLLFFLTQLNIVQFFDKMKKKTKNQSLNPKSHILHQKKEKIVAYVDHAKQYKNEDPPANAIHSNKGFFFFFFRSTCRESCAGRGYPQATGHRPQATKNLFHSDHIHVTS